MVAARRQLLVNFLKLFDLLVMVACFVAASYVVLEHSQSTLSFEELFSMRVKLGNFVLFGLLLVMWHAIFGAFGMYGSRRIQRRRYDVMDITKATTCATVFILLASVAFRIKMVSPLFLAVFWLFTTFLTVCSRLFLRAMLGHVRLHGHNLRHMLIVGTNPRALEFANRIACKPALGYHILGFVDREWDGMPHFRDSGFALVSDMDHLPEYLRAHPVDEVIVTLPLGSLHGYSSELRSICDEQGITIRVLNDFFDMEGRRAKAEEIEGVSLMTHYAGVAEGWPVYVKRAIDLVVSFIVLLMLAPALTIVTVFIKLTSPGPVFFVQYRMGLNKRRFKIYKFRTMVADAELKMREVEHLNEVSGPVFKIKNDPRITSLGRLLRKTSIDELPQLLNVLKGDMSLVGPRPLPVRDYEGFDKDWQRRRFSVRPGITCLWQIAGRSSIPFEKWMQMDLQYIDKWSLRLDFEILLRTIPAVIRGSGAA
jgi:exopolysaccharide biosynthesis polyprenyl glycosylphosphotransferase